MERLVEDSRVRCAELPDFTVGELFTLFDRTESGQLDAHDVKHGLELLGVPAIFDDAIVFVA